MTPQHDETNPSGANPPSAGFEEALSALDNPELLSALDSALLELEKRLYRYARLGPELLEMTDEGLVLAVRARLGQALSSAGTPRGTCR